MKLDKAIEIKELFYKGGKVSNWANYRKADLLSIEALKRIYNNRATTPGFNFIPLPGETEE